MIRSIEEAGLAGPARSLAFALALLLPLSGCGKTEKASAQPQQQDKLFDPAALQLDDPDLVAGRDVWIQTCSTCHLTGLTGAPKIGDKAAWAPRIAKGLETLYDHAINGFIGPEYTEMPPKGGFSELSDNQVRQAVRFVTHASQ